MQSCLGEERNPEGKRGKGKGNSGIHKTMAHPGVGRQSNLELWEAAGGIYWCLHRGVGKAADGGV